jgi:hypothetical protein
LVADMGFIISMSYVVCMSLACSAGHGVDDDRVHAARVRVNYGPSRGPVEVRELSEKVSRS